ncbi:MAG: response regulator [Parcubacteria group bacterium]|nr:response regulator [Parcubacteria group bacterium]
MATSKKILLIEDDRFLRKVYSNKLRTEGYDVIEAVNGEEGLHKIEKERPDLVVLDLILPRKNGFDVLSDMFAQHATRNIPVIILSNLGQKEDIERGLGLGAADYLIKTDMRLSDIVQKIKDHVRS